MQAWINTVTKTVGYWSRRASVRLSDSVSDVKTWGESANLVLSRAQIAIKDNLSALGIFRS